MHIITGEIRKAPFIKDKDDGSRMYILELSESAKDRNGETTYTNYKFFFNAKNDGMKSRYDGAFVVGKVVSITCEKLKVETSEHNGNTYTTLTPMGYGFPNLEFVQFGDEQKQKQQQATLQQRAPQQQSKPQQQNPQHDFDDDIPF